MTENEIMNLYLDTVESVKDSIIKDISEFVVNNKDDENFIAKFRQSFSIRVSDFSAKYHLSFPEAFLTDAVWAQETARRTMPIIMEAVNFQNSTLEDYHKNKEQNSPTQDE